MQGQVLIINILAGTFSALSAICCIINIILIRSLRKWNFFLAILFYTALCETIYSSTFYFNFCVDWGRDFNAVIAFFQIFSGIAVTLWTNVLSCVILYILKYRQAAHIAEHFMKLSLMVYIPAIGDALAQLLSWYEEDWYAAYVSAKVYYWIRVVSILFNFFVFAYIYRKMVRMRGTLVRPTPGEKSMFVVANRMMYYPIIQFLSRVFNAIYEEKYKFGQYTDVVPTGQFLMRCLVCVTQPSAGIGFLVVFLLFQPRARETLVSLLLCRYVEPIGEEDASSLDIEDGGLEVGVGGGHVSANNSHDRSQNTAAGYSTSGSRLSSSTLRALGGLAGRAASTSDRSSLNTIRMSDSSVTDRPPTLENGLSTVRETDILNDIKFSLMDDSVLFQYIARRETDQDSNDNF